MRLLTTSLTAAATAASVMFATPAFAHENYHNIETSGSMYLLDDENWPWSDESGWHSFSGATTVGPWITQNSYSTSHCVGDEVRGELRVTYEDSTQYPGYVLARVDARLYEGTDCGTTDLDGRRVMSQWVAAGAASTFAFRFTVRNHTR